MGDGLSASQIAAELGGITRNAVIGKVHRLGLSGRAKSPSSSAPRPRKAAPADAHVARAAPRHARQHRARAPAYDYEPEPEPEPIENIIPIGQRCTLLELDRARMPLADRRSRPAGLLLLRRQDRDRLPYCAYHARVAYQPGRPAPRPPPRAGVSAAAAGGSLRSTAQTRPAAWPWDGGVVSPSLVA